MYFAAKSSACNIYASLDKSRFWIRLSHAESNFSICMWKKIWLMNVTRLISRGRRETQLQQTQLQLFNDSMKQKLLNLGALSYMIRKYESMIRNTHSLISCSNKGILGNTMPSCLIGERLWEAIGAGMRMSCYELGWVEEIYATTQREWQVQLSAFQAQSRLPCPAG